MIITGLIGALVISDYKWGYFTGGCIAMLFVFYQLVVPGRSSARAISQAAYEAYFRSAIILSVLWFLYPIAWVSYSAGAFFVCKLPLTARYVFRVSLTVVTTSLPTPR